MLGWKLFLRAVTLLIENLGDALRVSAVPYLVLIAATVIVGPPEVDPTLPETGGEEAAIAAMAGGVWALPLLVLNLVVTLWVTVAWHRYVLLGETPTGWLPPMRGPEMLGYLWRSILIGLLVGLAIIGITIPLGALAVAIPVLVPLVPVVGLFLGALVFYRLAVSLPARAIGRQMGFGEAMEATRGHTGTVAALAVITVGFFLLLQLPTAIEGSLGLITIVYQGVVGWIGLLVGVSTLTALYGVVVEGRSVE
ncbi:hypothetical protein [Jannaschia formosa]|uniref:hypothetical protein n=1 Tax=Jannaschia formosa TaxID=2259592 RepID=UPI001431D647|nr:hypothetical protein [Jannaschia formosa]